ncbi:methylated-DNA--[protein]-cysteine S-methyltransferase [Radiobacillus sp. PE A8.2]|uniref:methylated-DNA--[protein]-cysteine S-methyltransferase n=1 Tax=Radiobacillus sp. PE A8.2 TaxID=3380349 RepID=UPI0038910740
MNDDSYLYYDELETPIGVITVIASQKGICRVDFGRMKDISTSCNLWGKKHFQSPEFINDQMQVESVKRQLTEYFIGERQLFEIDLDLYGTPFQKKVWDALYAEIPYGETRSYKEIAKSIHAPKAIRAVGGAVNKNPIAIIIPCHRVIGSNGSLVGYNGGIDKKEHLLRLENAPI